MSKTNDNANSMANAKKKRLISIAQIANPFILLVFFLCVVLMVLEYQVSYLIDEKNKAIDQYVLCVAGTDEFHYATELLTNEARIFVSGQGADHYVHYQEEAGEGNSRIKALQALKEAGVDESAVKSVEAAYECSNALMEREMLAMALAARSGMYDASSIPRELLDYPVPEAYEAYTKEQLRLEITRLLYGSEYVNLKSKTVEYLYESNSRAEEAHKKLWEEDVARHAVLRSVRDAVYLLLFLAIAVFTVVFSRTMYSNVLNMIDAVKKDEPMTPVRIKCYNFLAESYNKMRENVKIELKHSQITREEFEANMYETKRYITTYDLVNRTFLAYEVDEAGRLQGPDAQPVRRFFTNMPEDFFASMEPNLSEESMKKLREFFLEIPTGKAAGEVEFEMKQPDGSEDWRRCTYHTIFNDAGEPVRAIVTMAHITNEKKQQKLYEEYISSLEERVLNNNGIFIRMNVANDQVVKIGQYALGVSKRTPAETTTQLAEHFEEFSLRSKAGKTFAEMYGKEALEEQFEQGNHDFVTYWNLQRADGTMAELAIIAALMTHPITRELEAVLQLYTKDRASSIQTGERRRVLYIQPPDRMRDSLVDALNPYFDIKVVNNCNDANLVLSLDSQYDIMLLDLASEDALAFIKETRELRKKLPLLAITDGNIPQEIAVLELGVADIQPKPVNTTLIKHRINNILEKREALLAAREDLSNRDELTGLYGRKTFIALAKELIRNAGEDEHFAMLCFDIAEFRTLNSIYGSEQCDEILKKIARMLKRTISGSLGIVMRTRADRFYAFIPKNDTLIELILEAIKDLKFGLPTDVTVRVGIYPASHEDSVETMMNNVLLPIEYLRQDKTKTVAWFDENMREADLISQRIREEFAAAIRDSKIAVYFQPKIDYKKKYYVGAEALVRWKHPDFGSITPDKYVPILEQHGLITQLDLYVLEKTCEYQRKWKDEGLRTVRVSVNFSPLDFKAPGLAEKILSIIEKYGLGYKDIRFEITETAYINDPEILTEFIDTVHAKGYLVDMDDFGSGYSSLSMLDEIHVDAVKLDMRMTRNRNNRSMHILGAIIRMAGWLKMDVIAEGVETEAQAESLRALGCVYMQGHLFDKPLPATLFRECLIKNGEKIGEVLEVIPTEIIEKGVTLENVAAMDVSDMSGLFKAIGTIFTLVISQNYTKNMYYIMEYDNFGNQTAPTRGTYDDLIQTGASTFHQEEQQSFLSTFRRENVISQFENGGDNLMHIGRQMGSDGKYHWVRTTVLLYRDGDGDIRGYALARNVDDEYSNRIASAGYQNVILGMSKAFIFVYEIDITAGLLIEIHNTEEYREFITPVSDFETSLRLMADRDLEPGEFEKNKWFWDFSDITNRIDTGSRVSALFNTRTTGWQMSTLVELERDVEGNVTKVLWLSQDVNEKIGHERHFNDVRETFADSFDLAYQIDINTGMCYEIKSDARLRKLIPPVGNVQEVIQNYLAYAVEEEYRSRMYDFINLSTLHERIKGKKRITEEYKGKLFSWLRAVIVPLTYGENGEVQQFVFGVNTIEKEKLAEYDSMTGVLNSGAATEMIEGMFIREEARDAAMLIIDIDNLKTLNDTYGHQSGTDAIIGVAKCIREQFEEEGVVGRYGGDEFIVFFKDAGNRRPELMTKIENLIRDVRRGEWIPDCTVTCTIGLAFVERDVTDFKGVFERADNALYHAKSASKNTFRIYGE